MAFASGTRLGPYEITAQIGVGGMGEVYRATDTKLKREVAIKVLPSHVAADPERLARFQREAEVLASLNHPNIAAIYGLEEADSTKALVMELVEGSTLEDRITQGAIPVDEALRIAKQVAEALEAAHEQGIIHRDLKPANIKVRPDGTVKVLDFGLAKALEPTGAISSEMSQAPTMTTPAMTQAGMILGTAAYMSPEQARGQKTNRQTDIWAFGCVLHEMLSGRPAFRGETVSDTIAQVLERDPDETALPAATPDVVRRVLRTCLEKDRRERWRDIGDVGLGLRESTSSSSASSSKSSDRVWSGRRLGIELGVAALLIGLTALWFGRGTVPAPGSPLAGATFTNVTNFEGDEEDAAISPDGRFVAFVAGGEDVFDVWLSQVDTGSLSNLTLGQIGDVRGPEETRSVGFHGDGSQVWVGGAPWRRMQFISLVGGAVRNALGELVINADWSPDGAQVVYHTREDGDPIYVADADGANSTLIVGSDVGQHQHFPVWSPDGEWIYLARGRPATGEMALWRVRPDGEDLERLTGNQLDVEDPTPLDARTVVYVAREENGAGPWLWALDVASKESQRVFFGLEQYTAVAASADGQRLVASVASPEASLWSVPILDGVAREDDVQPFMLPSVRALSPRFGPNRLFYLSSRGTSDGLWRLENGEVVEVRSGAGAPLLAPAAVSPDGSSVAVVPRRDERLALEIVSADGAETIARIDSIDVRGAAAWSPDGQWIVTGGRGPDGTGLFKIPVDGGDPEILARGAAINPVWSPKGDLIVYAGPQVQADAAILAVRPDGTSVDLPGIRVLRTGQRFRFLPDGEGLVYMQGELPSAQDFWLLDFESLSSRRLTELDSSATMNSFDITPDGATIVFDRLRQNSNVVLIDLPS